MIHIALLALVWLAAPTLRHPAPARVIAIGDVHGDLAATRAALRIGGAIDESDRWIGGRLVVVQVGDVLDRGDDERAILDLFERLEVEAAAVGGAFIGLNGNHEIMNAVGDLSYVTAGGFAAFAKVPVPGALAPALESLPVAFRGRAAAFAPGGPFARRLARRGVFAIVGDTVYVHGGLLPAHVRHGLARYNADASAWLRGEIPLPAALHRLDSPVWTRAYAGPADAATCERLGAALAELGAKRLVVGHTPQVKGISDACGGLVWRIDVGMARHYGGRPAVLEITDDRVRTLTAPVASTGRGE